MYMLLAKSIFVCLMPIKYLYCIVKNNPFLVYCRELAPGTVSLTGDRAQGDDSKHDLHYSLGSV